MRTIGRVWLGLAAIGAACGAVGACGPDPAPEVSTPAPPPPGWAVGLLGKPLASLGPVSTTCRGVVDLVSAKHTAARPGSELEGWGWDAAARRPFVRVVFASEAGRVIGGADEGRPRPDVPKALPQVTTDKVGWKGATPSVSGVVAAFGLTASGGICPIGKTSL